MKKALKVETTHNTSPKLLSFCCSIAHPYTILYSFHHLFWCIHITFPSSTDITSLLYIIIHSLFLFFLNFFVLITRNHHLSHITYQLQSWISLPTYENDVRSMTIHKKKGLPPLNQIIGGKLNDLLFYIILYR